MLPSSLHELILVPKSEGINGEMLQKMIREVNATQVPMDEVLSDNLYVYTVADNVIKIWNEDGK